MVDYNKEMFSCIENDQLNLFKQHLVAGAEINSRNSDNRTALHVSIFKRSDSISNEILSSLERATSVLSREAKKGTASMLQMKSAKSLTDALSVMVQASAIGLSFS